MEEDKVAPIVELGPSDDEVGVLLDELIDLESFNLIGLLQDVQDRFGFLPQAALEEISKRTGISLSRIYGVVSFYSQFYTEPHGRHTVRCCRGTACHVNGAKRIIDALEAELGISDGQTTPDQVFFLESVACLGTCFLAPVMMIDDQYFGKLTSGRVGEILKSYRANEL